MEFQLKDFQQTALDKLRDYFKAVQVSGDPRQAFMAVASAGAGRTPSYHVPVKGLETVPYVCLRLPTGGGKTILGAYAIRVAAQNFIEKEYPVVLWLVPSNTIRKQTADALKKLATPTASLWMRRSAAVFESSRLMRSTTSARQIWCKAFA